MLKNFDHVTIVVRDVDAAKRFFGLLGFKESKSVVISGKIMDDYMGVPGLEAEHVTLVLEHVSPRTEVQLLRYHHPDAIVDPNIAKLNKLGFNHICFAVDNIEAEVAKLKAAGVRLRNEVMDFHSRKLVFVYGPEDVTVELAQWDA
jgi:catechol 2,3-dioxygenase-like lactoylglutathione lyase family enzyme